MLSAPAGAASSLVIVPVAVDVPSVAPPVGALSATENVSLGSKSVSPWIGTWICAVVAPSTKVTVPVDVNPAPKSLASVVPLVIV